MIANEIRAGQSLTAIDGVELARPMLIEFRTATSRNMIELTAWGATTMIDIALGAMTPVTVASAPIG